MTDWTAGYVADVGYTFGYYNELNPQRLLLPFLSSGYAPPEGLGAACELGFGQGLSINVHAAASTAQWHGTDFNPSQAGFAQELARAASSSCVAHDEAFAEFCTRRDLPDFDYIGLHGIWSWISDENRHVIVDFVRRKLKVGGVLYISYNTLPGWAAFAPMRHLMTEHAEIIGSEGRGIVSRINDALDFSEKLLATNPTYARANPQIADRLKKLKEQNRQYLAHEYFNKDWHPMHFGTLADWLEPAKVQFACSAYSLDHVDVLNLTPEQQKFLAEIPDQMLRQSVRDFMVNQQFRRDYWVKGVRRLSPLEQAERLRAVRVILVNPRDDIALKVTGALSEATLTETVYNPLLDALADHKVRSLGQLETELKAHNINFTQLLQAIMILIGMGHVGIAQDDSVQNKARKTSDKLNDHLLLKARGAGDVGFLASPVTGGGIPVPRFSQLFLLALKRGQKRPEEIAAFAWNILQAQGQRLVKEGKTVDKAEDNLAELQAQAQRFMTKNLPALKALMIA